MFAENHSMGSKLVAFTISLFCIIYQAGGQKLSAHQEKDLNSVNPSIFKTITTEYGDIFDCVNIHKQFSLDHPLLQNHTLQMSPSWMLESSSDESTEAEFKLENGGCPEGSVPIRRTTKKDLRRFKTYLKENPSALNINPIENAGFRFAKVHTTTGNIKFDGARGKINVYNPRVLRNQHSDSIIYATSGRYPMRNVLQAGWAVNPRIYGDALTRLNTLWTSDSKGKTGCINLLCKGFVQISKDLPLGIHIQPSSTRGGQQYDIPISISRDQFSGNWWLIASKNVVVGYWPKEIFTSLGNYALEVGWGGRVYNPVDSWYPQMGSGAMPSEGMGKACFMSEMQFVKYDSGAYTDVDEELIHYIDAPSCYSVEVSLDSQRRGYILFGGPGGRCDRNTTLV